MPHRFADERASFHVPQGGGLVERDGEEAKAVGTEFRGKNSNRQREVRAGEILASFGTGVCVPEAHAAPAGSGHDETPVGAEARIVGRAAVDDPFVNQLTGYGVPKAGFAFLGAGQKAPTGPAAADGWRGGPVG